MDRIDTKSQSIVCFGEESKRFAQRAKLVGSLLTLFLLPLLNVALLTEDTVIKVK